MKFAINSHLRTVQILTNDTQMLILSPSYFITAVTQAMFVRFFTHFIGRHNCTFFSYEIVKELKSQDLNM